VRGRAVGVVNGVRGAQLDGLRVAHDRGGVVLVCGRQRRAARGRRGRGRRESPYWVRSWPMPPLRAGLLPTTRAAQQRSSGGKRAWCGAQHGAGAVSCLPAARWCIELDFMSVATTPVAWHSLIARGWRSCPAAPLKFLFACAL
jgi:hypothetical protein